MRILAHALVLALAGATAAQQGAARKILVAHRGASGSAPEHTMAAYRLALAQGADYVEQDLQITSDGVLVCLHDLTLERTTDVEDVFPDRSRPGARGQKTWPVSGFTLAEIKRLDAGAWFGAAFAGERVPTWQEAIDLIKGKAGLYPETKAPDVYGGRGFDMEALVLAQLAKNGLDTPGADPRTPVIIQSFSDESLRRMQAMKSTLPRVFLIADAEPGRTRWLSDEGLRSIAGFAQGIGPAKSLVLSDRTLTARAHAAGLTVTPYSFRASTAPGAPRVRDEMSLFLYDIGVDALFTDNPDQFPRR
jgi:glycerophosphoryl diester phosphodiesterase